MSVKPIPDGYHSVTPYLTVYDAAKAIDFYKAAFGATEIARMDMGGKIGHAEIRVGDSVVMLSDEFPDRGKLGPKARGGATASLMVYLDDGQLMFKRANRDNSLDINFGADDRVFMLGRAPAKDCQFVEEAVTTSEPVMTGVSPL